MTFRLLKYITPIILIGVFFSCETVEILPEEESSSFNASVDGTNFNIASVNANLFTFLGDSTLEITATDQDGSIIVISFNSLETKTYSTSGETDPEIVFVYRKSIGDGVTTSEEGSSGFLTLTAHDLINEVLTGTFSFETENYSISSGSFDQLKY